MNININDASNYILTETYYKLQLKLAVRLIYSR